MGQDCTSHVNMISSHTFNSGIAKNFPPPSFIFLRFPFRPLWLGIPFLLLVVHGFPRKVWVLWGWHFPRETHSMRKSPTSPFSDYIQDAFCGLRSSSNHTSINKTHAMDLTREILAAESGPLEMLLGLAITLLLAVYNWVSAVYTTHITELSSDSGL